MPKIIPPTGNYDETAIALAVDQQVAMVKGTLRGDGTDRRRDLEDARDYIALVSPVLTALDRVSAITHLKDWLSAAVTAKIERIRGQSASRLDDGPFGTGQQTTYEVCLFILRELTH